MNEYKAVALSVWLTARETNAGQILLFTPSDQTEAGHISQANEIFMSRKMIAQLAAEFPVHTEANSE